jgi:hypothetical protein
MKRKRFDLLRLAVFDDVEVRLFQIGDLRPGLVVADDDVDADEVDAAPEHRRWLRLVGRRRLGLRRGLLRRRLGGRLLRAAARAEDGDEGYPDCEWPKRSGHDLS